MIKTKCTFLFTRNKRHLIVPVKINTNSKTRYKYVNGQMNFSLKTKQNPFASIIIRNTKQVDQKHKGKQLHALVTDTIGATLDKS